jgi:CRP-like cAMP-binding protein
MKFAAHDRGTARTLIRSSAVSPPRESISNRISVAERQPAPRIVGLVSTYREVRPVSADEGRFATPGWPRLVPDMSLVERISINRAMTFTYLRGQSIFGPNEGRGVVYIVRAGCVRLFKTLANGRSISLGLYGPDTVFAQEECDNGLATGVTAEALVDTSISALERSALSAYLAESPELASTIIDGLMRHQANLHQIVELVLARDVTVRLAAVLLDLGNRFGSPMTDGFTKIALPVPHQLLANMIGSNRVTVTRKLAEMREMGMVGSLRRPMIAIQPALLHAHIRAASTADNDPHCEFDAVGD